MKTTTMGTVRVYWLINLIRLVNSIILCKHWRCDRLVNHFSERENHTFLTEKKLGGRREERKAGIWVAL